MTSQQSETSASNATPAAEAPATKKSETTEFEPPVACIRRLLKNALPKSTNVSKDSAAAITRACGIFVLYLTSCANDLAREERRTTVSAKDVLGALQELDFEEFTPQMEKFLEQHRKEEKTKKEEKEKLKAAAAKKGDAADADKKEDTDKNEQKGETDKSSVDKEGDEASLGKEHARDEDGERASPAKKQKVDD